MVLEAIPVISTAYLFIITGILLLAGSYYYRTKEYSRYIAGSGVILLAIGLLLVVYFISSFG